MFIAKPQKIKRLQRSPMLLPPLDMALRWSANPLGWGAIDIWPRRGQIPATDTLLLTTDRLGYGIFLASFCLSSSAHCLAETNDCAS